MIDPLTAAAAVSTGVTVALAWILVFWCYRNYRVDLFRERMFALRQELFNLADEGEIDFRDESYRLVRTTLNGFIRFGHRVNVIGLLAGVWAFRTELHENPNKSFTRRFEIALRELPPQSRVKLERIVQRMNFYTADQVIFSSVVLMVLYAPTALVLFAKSAGGEATARLVTRKVVRRRWAEPVDSVAYHFGNVRTPIPMAA